MVLHTDLSIFSLCSRTTRALPKLMLRSIGWRITMEMGILRKSWREMPVISRQIGLRHDRTSIDKKKSKKKMAQANTRLRDEKLPNSYSPVVFPSVLKHLKRYNERLLLFELSSSLSRIDNVLVNFRKKSNNPHISLRRKDVFSCSHRSLRSRLYRQCSFARTSSPRTLSICRLCFGSAILGANACIHPFSSLLSMLGSHRDK